MCAAIFHDRGKQGERATPRSAKSHTVVHYLANEVLHTPTGYGSAAPSGTLTPASMVPA